MLNLIGFTKIKSAKNTGDLRLYFNGSFSLKYAKIFKFGLNKEEKSKLFSYKASYNLGSVSYKFFNEFRYDLANLFKYKKLRLNFKQLFSNEIINIYTHKISNKKPFHFLLDFSDNEGTLSGNAIKQTIKDFKKYDKYILKNINPKYFHFYNDLKKLFIFSGFNGAISYS